MNAATEIDLSEPAANTSRYPEFKIGDVVESVAGRGRRFIVVSNQFGRYALRAISGAIRGSGPTNVEGGLLVLSTDQSVRFEGKIASKLHDHAMFSLIIRITAAERSAALKVHRVLGLAELVDILRGKVR